MKTQTIYKGFHRPFQLIPACFRFLSFSKHFRISKHVLFTDSCRYNLSGKDQKDWNKLFGFCYGILGIHRNSVRFVWRYNTCNDKIEIAAYYYINKQRIITIISSPLMINKIHSFKIERYKDVISMFLDGNQIDHLKLSSNKPAFGCGLYFGGNRRAPQNITIKIQ